MRGFRVILAGRSSFIQSMFDINTSLSHKSQEKWPTLACILSWILFVLLDLKLAWSIDWWQIDTRLLQNVKNICCMTINWIHPKLNRERERAMEFSAYAIKLSNWKFHTHLAYYLYSRQNNCDCTLGVLGNFVKNFVCFARMLFSFLRRIFRLMRTKKLNERIVNITLRYCPLFGVYEIPWICIPNTTWWCFIFVEAVS